MLKNNKFALIAEGKLQVRCQSVQELTKDRIAKRLVQIEIGKNSVSYQRYRKAVDKNKRRAELSKNWNPSTPDPLEKCSSRNFAGRLREWKKRIHLWGNLSTEEFEQVVNSGHGSLGGAPLNELSKDSENDGLDVCSHPPIEEVLIPSCHKECNKDSSCVPPNAAPHCVEMGHRALLQTGIVSVTPVYESAEFLALLKKSAILQGARLSAARSQKLAKKLTKFHLELPMKDAAISLDSCGCNFYVNTGKKDTGKPNEAIKNIAVGSNCQKASCCGQPNCSRRRRLKPNEHRVAFLPKNFRSMQLWPRCDFLREEDLDDAARKQRNFAEKARCAWDELKNQKHILESNFLELGGMQKRYGESFSALHDEETPNSVSDESNVAAKCGPSAILYRNSVLKDIKKLGRLSDRLRLQMAKSSKFEVRKNHESADGNGNCVNGSQKIVRVKSQLTRPAGSVSCVLRRRF